MNPGFVLLIPIMLEKQNIEKVWNKDLYFYNCHHRKSEALKS